MFGRIRGDRRYSDPPEEPRPVWYEGRPFILWRSAIDYGYLGSVFETAEEEGHHSEDSAKCPIHRGELQVQKVDFQPENNVMPHFTHEFDITTGPEPQLVVRRGQEFTIKLEFTRPYKEEDDLRLVFQIGDYPITSEGTQVMVRLTSQIKEKQWGAKVKQRFGNSVTVTVSSPPDCIVGKWRFRVYVVVKRGGGGEVTVLRYNHKHFVYMLFNPWCKADPVYMDGIEERQAYVLREYGKLFLGTYKQWTAKPWNFGQFTAPALDCAMYLLDKSKLKLSARGDPVSVSRRLSAMVNSNDDRGVLSGRWHGPYDDGTSPLRWSGSVRILKEYYKYKRPVKYGQCWVFSGVLTTVYRALGLPTRSVTNFSSAHDTNANIGIDEHFDDVMNRIPANDSIWNFHVWNEAWMARPDLPEGYGGWQAFDSTPRKLSDGVFCCGPCPVRAIKEGQMNIGYDAPFIFAEVNADQVHWVREEDGSFKKTHVVKDATGKMMSTLSLEGNEREDVTQWYKYDEDSPEERMAVMKAVRMVRDEDEVEPMDKHLEFQLTFDENIFVGDDLLVTLQAKNVSSVKRSIDGILSVGTMYYTGVVANCMGTLPLTNVELEAGDVKYFCIQFDPDTYLGWLEDCCMMSLYAMTTVRDSNQVFTKKDTARFRKPHLHMKGPDWAKKDEEFDVVVSFKNPLNRTLTECYLEVEGQGVDKSYPQGDVQPKKDFTFIVKLKLRKRSEREIVATFNCRQLEDINGSLAVKILDWPTPE